MKDQQEKKWYPIYTKSRFEKKSYLNLIKAGYEAFLPIRKTYRQWSDRKKLIEVPLFNSYLFVRIPEYELFNVLKINGLVRYIHFNGRPASARNHEIEIIRSILNNQTEVEVIDGNVQIGTEVRIKSGLLQGYTGRIIKKSGKNKFVISIESLNKSLLITLEQSKVIGI